MEYIRKPIPNDGTKSEVPRAAILAYADRTRGLPLVDPVDRALTISCGAALSHLLIAIRHFKHTYKIELFPDSNNRDLISRIVIDDDRKEPFGEENSLFAAITKRRTNRLKFEDRELEESLISKLRSVLITDKEEATEVACRVMHLDIAF
jgi:hypothetical protein